MNTEQQSLETLKDIRQMMERSSRFISLSGLSGVAAGVCALAGAWVAGNMISENAGSRSHHYTNLSGITVVEIFRHPLMLVAIITFVAALLLAFVFTWMRSRKNGIPLWGPVSRKLSFSMLIPMAAGGIFLIKLLQAGNYELMAPGCLLFYGLALVNASRYTLSEIRWLGYAELATGILCLFVAGNGIYFWAFGFGILHIVYGLVMWFRYER